MAALSGSCHCGNLTVRLETARAPADLQVRACQCSFCRRHASRNVSDPAGVVRLRVGDPQRLIRYRFGLRTADFWVCGRCGVYVAAVCRVDGADYATVNIRCLDARDEFSTDVAPVSYENEDATSRLARRKSRWTPAELHLGAEVGAPGKSSTEL